MNKTNNQIPADVGDYLKVFACTAVMLQPIIAQILTKTTSLTVAMFLVLLDNLVKYTAPAFIFGILYTHSRLLLQKESFNYPLYLKHSWSNLFCPAIIWSFCYLILMPQLQVISHYHDALSFIWQLLNGNAASHLWYNTMMLQFIILMPLFWWLARYAKTHLLILVLGAILIYFLWICFYDLCVFHGALRSWYLLDRFWVSFLIYAIFGFLAYQKRDFFEKVINRFWPLFLLIALLTFSINNLFFFRYQNSFNLANISYYQPIMIFYDLAVIALIAKFALYCQTQHYFSQMRVIHFLATYAYRAYLANVFVNQLIWHFLGFENLASSLPVFCLIFMWILTWSISFSLVFLLAFSWKKIKVAL